MGHEAQRCRNLLPTLRNLFRIRRFDYFSDELYQNTRVQHKNLRKIVNYHYILVCATECDLDDEVTAHSVQLLPEFDKSAFWKEVGFDLAKRVFARDSIYYTHSCGIRTTSWKSNAILVREFNLLGTSIAKNGIEFVANIEHKKYPFISNQWHPEKNPYERGHLYHFLDRSSDATTLMTRIAAKFVNPIREKGNPKDIRDIDPLVKSYFVSALMAEYLPLSFYERVYTFQRYNYYE